MATTDFGNSPTVAVTPTITLDGLGVGAVATSSAITTPTTAGGNYYERARLEINLGASTAVGTSGTPNISAVLFGSAAGTTVLPPTGVSNGQIYPITGSRVGGNTIVSTSTQLLVVDEIPVPPIASPELSVLNGLGVAFPTNTPPAAPTLSSVAAGTLAATTYYVKITYVNAAGETLPSAEASLAVAADYVLSVASPAATSGASGWNVFVSTTSGTETLQNSSPIAIGTAWQEPTTGLISGSALPTTSTFGVPSATLYFYTPSAG